MKKIQKIIIRHCEPRVYRGVKQSRWFQNQYFFYPRGIASSASQTCLLAMTFLVLLIGITNHTYALTTTPSPSDSPTTTLTSPLAPTTTLDINQQLNNLKNRIASKVAQLKLVEKRGIIGIVTDVAGTQLTINDKDGNTRFVDVDEFTKFSSPSAKTSFGISDITKGITVGVLGIYNKESRRITGRFVDVLVLQRIISGAVTNIDNKNFSLTVTTPDQKDFHIDIETITKTYVYDTTSGLTKSGFSKIQHGERVIIAGYTDIKDKNNIISSRIIRLPSLKPNPKIPIVKSDNLSITPSSASGEPKSKNTLP